MLLFNILLLVVSTFGQKQNGYLPPVSPASTVLPPVTQNGYLPPVSPASTVLPPVTYSSIDVLPVTTTLHPTTNTVVSPDTSTLVDIVTSTVTKTNTLTVADCRTVDKYVTNTYEVINQQIVLITLCTKNVVTETLKRTIVTPVNNHVVIRSTTEQIQPKTTIVTDIGDRHALSTVFDTTIATLTHRENEFFSTTITETRTQTLTLTTLDLSTQVNTRTVRLTATRTVLNTLVVDAVITQIAPVSSIPFVPQGYGPQAAPISSIPFVPQPNGPQTTQGSSLHTGASNVINGKVLSFGGQTTGTDSSDQGIEGLLAQADQAHRQGTLRSELQAKLAEAYAKSFRKSAPVQPRLGY